MSNEQVAFNELMVYALEDCSVFGNFVITLTYLY